MIKLPPGPAIWVMALLTALPKCLVVVVVAMVATDAGESFGFVSAVGMAALAIGHGVHTVKRHTGQVVIKTDIFKPAAGFMTLSALVAQFAVMNIIRVMAIGAMAGIGMFIHLSGVAAVATGLLMGTVKWEFGILIVIEL